MDKCKELRWRDELVDKLMDFSRDYNPQEKEVRRRLENIVRPYVPKAFTI